MGQTPDRDPGIREEEEILFEDQPGGSPSAPGSLMYADGAFIMEDSAGPYDPRTGGTASSNVFLDRVISSDIDVLATKTLLAHDPLLVDGVCIDIADGGEVLFI